ncbi:hypothetical protein [Kibdelosporangium aridum]|uniref:hypothetical protein n=1 Tax=Kibdelosporangium aridum TaxID=2030 RepID=UPI0035E9ACCE
MPGAVLNEALGGPFEGSPPRVLFGLFTMPIPALELDGLAPAPAVDVKLPVATVEQSWGIVPAEDGGLRLRVKYSTELFRRRHSQVLDASLPRLAGPCPG